MMKSRLKPLVATVASVAALGTSAAFASGTSTTDPAKDRNAAASGAPATATVTTILIIDEPSFAELDRNRDQRLSKEEVGSHGQAQQHWSAMDRDRDGYLTREELARFHAQMGSGQGSQTSGQGAQSGMTGANTAGASSGAQPGTSRSTSQSGQGSGDSARSDRSGQSPASGQSSRDHTGGTAGMDRSRAAQGSDQQRGAQANSQVTAPVTMAVIVIDETQFLQLDTDRDNRLSKEEVRAVSRLQKSWGAFDKDSNGYLTRSEIADYNQQMTQGQGSSGSQSAASGGKK